MGLSIKNDEVETRVRELVALTGLGVTEAIDFAVREALSQLTAADAKRRAASLAALEALLTRTGPLGIDDAQSDSEMYDATGAPR